MLKCMLLPCALHPVGGEIIDTDMNQNGMHVGLGVKLEETAASQLKVQLDEEVKDVWSFSSGVL